MKSALVIRHVPYEDLAAFRAPISQAGYAIGYADVGDAAFDGIDFLAPDLLILMGGPMGVYETDRHPWLPPELERLSARLAADAPPRGVCLGRKILAAALGAAVYTGPCRDC